MGLRYITAPLAVAVYWIKLIVATILFFTGDFETAVKVLLIGAIIEGALYWYTIRD